VPPVLYLAMHAAVCRELSPGERDPAAAIPTWALPDGGRKEGECWGAYRRQDLGLPYFGSTKGEGRKLNPTL
jgi:hypothetical protein